MDYQKTKIEFYRQRTFSEKFNATFDFIRENWKPLLKYTFYLIMPICLVQTFAMNAFFRGYFGLILRNSNQFSGSLTSFMSNYGILLFCIMIGSVMLFSMVAAMMQTYATRENRLQNVVLDDFKEAFVRNIGRCLRLVFLFVFAYIAIVLVAVSLAYAVSYYSLIITIPIIIIFILCMIPLFMTIPVYIFERDIKIFDAIRKAWKLSMATLGGMIGFLIVLYIISSVIQTLAMLPWYITLAVGEIFSISTQSTMNESVIYKFMLYIFGLIQAYGMYVSSIISAVGLAFQYFHAREKVEGITIESNISNFNELQ